MCEAQTTKKYVERASPPFPAQACAGRTMKGNDGCMYVSSKVGSQKVHNWKPVHSSCSPAARRRSAKEAEAGKSPKTSSAKSPKKASPVKKSHGKSPAKHGKSPAKHGKSPAKHGKSPAKRCDKGMILNPATNRCVKKDGAVGRRLRGSM